MLSVRLRGILYKGFFVLMICFIATTATFFLTGRVSNDSVEFSNVEIEKKSTLQRYSVWIKSLITFENMGFTAKGKSVWRQLETRAPITLSIGFFSWLLAWILGLFVAWVLSQQKSHRSEFFLSTFYPSFQAIPGILVLFVMCYLLDRVSGKHGWSPWIPAVLSLIVLLTPSIAALWLQSFQRIQDQEYIRVAIATGVPRSRLWSHHIIPASLASSGLLNQMVFSLSGLLTGSFFVEKLFRIDGLTKPFLEAFGAGECEMAATAAMLFFIPLSIGILLAETALVWLDPEQSFKEDSQTT